MAEDPMSSGSCAAQANKTCQGEALEMAAVQWGGEGETPFHVIVLLLHLQFFTHPYYHLSTAFDGQDLYQRSSI